MRIGQLAVDTLPLRSSRGFRWMYFGRLGTLLGNWLVTASASWQIYALTR